MLKRAPIIQKEEITDKVPIGKGSFGEVFKGRCRGMDVAVKAPLQQMLEPEQKAALYREVDIMSNIYHSNVCRFMGVCLEEGNIQIVSELMEGDLNKLLSSEEMKEICVSTRIGWALEAAKGISWMHAHTPPILHLDIKPDNILYDAKMRIKVCDFGLSIFKEGRANQLSRPTGTPLFMAPEFIRMIIYDTNKTLATEKSDVYSFALVIWQILTKKGVFSHHITARSSQRFYRAILKGERPDIPKYCVPRLRKLLVACWSDAPTDRPSFTDIVKELKIIQGEYVMHEANRKMKVDISDAAGRQFWSSHFSNEESVDWLQFSSDFLSDLNQGGVVFDINSCEMKCLKSILLEGKSNCCVSRNFFGKVLGWFGPLTFPYQEGKPHFLQRLSQTVMLPYFHGTMSGTVATTLLERNATPGQFLVRFSGNHSLSFCISRMDTSTRSVLHLVVTAENSFFLYKKTPYTDFHQLIIAAAPDLKLTSPCICTKYQNLGEKPKSMEWDVEASYI